MGSKNGNGWKPFYGNNRIKQIPLFEPIVVQEWDLGSY
jgi:hypothetical protein